MVITNLFTHIWLVEPKKNQLIFHARCDLDCFFYLFLIIPTLMHTIFLRLTSNALRVRSFYGCIANYANFSFFFCSKTSFNGRVGSVFDHEAE
jgi:hypothetical protein